MALFMRLIRILAVLGAFAFATGIESGPQKNERQPSIRSDEPKLDTIEKCRSYREAWNASAIDDQASLTVRQLIYRSDQMFNCGAKIDGTPFKEGMSSDEALKLCIEHQSYAILSSNYEHEVIYRLTWFLQKKGLSAAFVAEDEKRAR